MRRILWFPFLLIMGLTLSSCYDSINEPENQFVKIYFKYGHKDVLNTFNNTYQKDMVLDGTITVNFWLTTDEQNRILNKANEIKFFSLPDMFEPDSSLGIPSENLGPQKLRIDFNDEDKTVIWTYPLNSNDPQVKSLMELQNFIISVIEAKPEYKRLPEPRSGYW